MPPPPPPPPAASPCTPHAPRILIIGAGARGKAYAAAIAAPSNPGVVHAVAEPLAGKRAHLGRRYIWGNGGKPGPGQSFESWRDFIAYETRRREREEREAAELANKAVGGGDDDDDDDDDGGRGAPPSPPVEPGVDAVLVCVLDDMHRDVVVALAQLPGRRLSIMCEKPLATNLADCLDMRKAVLGDGDGVGEPAAVFSIGHVLRYSPHNMLLRKLLLEDRVIGDVMSVVHTEPVGWWHFAHSYVRGNWRKESMTAPSLLTKCCHDIDLILWLLSHPTNESASARHHPAYVTSTGSLQYYRRGRKPPAAGTATNCLSCPIESNCHHSAKKVYVDSEVGTSGSNVGWPVHIVVDDIEDITRREGRAGAQAAVMAKLAEDYGPDTPQQAIDARPWFGRCVWECDNDVCDDQIVTLTWEDEEEETTKRGSGKQTDPTERRKAASTTTTIDHPSATSPSAPATRDHITRGPKTATIHMVAQTLKRRKRYTHIYGTHGELYADGTSITVYPFDAVLDDPRPAGGPDGGSAPPPVPDTTRVYHAGPSTGGHSGGDVGLAGAFLRAVDAVTNGGWSVACAQAVHIGATLDDVLRSHGVVFAAEQARRERVVVDLRDWWRRSVEEGVGA